MSARNQAYEAPLIFELRTVGLSVFIHGLMLFGLIYCYVSAIDFLMGSYRQMGASLPAMAGAFIRLDAGWQSDSMALAGWFGLAMAADAVIGLCILLYYSETGRRTWSIWTSIAMLTVFAHGIFFLLYPVRNINGI